MASYLLDTCAVIWIAEGIALQNPARKVLSSTYENKFTVSTISAWEVAQLVASGKLALSVTPLTWFERFVQSELVDEIELSATVLVASTALPDAPVNDPADRVLIATAREFGLTLVTRDRKILEYGKQGHVNVLKC